MAIHDLFRSEAVAARGGRVYGEIVLAQPLGTQTLVLPIFGVTAALAAWVALGSYTRTQVAPGLLVTDRASAKIIAIRPGLVTELTVREGQLVGRGQRLATIRIEQRSETGASAVADGLEALAAQRGLTQDRIRLAADRAATERAKLSANFDGLRQQQADLAGQMALQEEAIASARDLLDRIQVVAARAEAESIAQRQAQLRSERAYAITAPIAGRVAAVQTAPGRTVDPAIPMMVIVPEGSKLHAEIYAPTRAIGFVKPGQEVRLLYDAFPYQRFGSFTGRIRGVSQTVLDPGEISAPLKIEEPVYRIEVTPERQQVGAYGDALRLQTGMTLTANLILERRSFADWLLEPLYAVLRRNRS